PDLPRLVVQGRFLAGRRAADNGHLLDGQPHPLVPIPACQRASHLCYRISNRNTFGTSISRGQGVCHGSRGWFRNDLTGSGVESLGWQDGFQNDFGSSPRGPAAVDGEDRARAEAGGVGGQKDGGAFELDGVA